MTITATAEARTRGGITSNSALTRTKSESTHRLSRRSFCMRFSTG